MRSNVSIRQCVRGAIATAAALGFSGLVLAQQHNAGEMRHGRVETTVTPSQVAAQLKNSKRSLAENISAAEKHCGGRAVRAECCNHVTGAMCMVTMLVGENRLVEATVNTQTGEIISQRDLENMSFFGAANDDFAMASSWQKFSDLTAKKVTNAANEDLGKLEDIVVDTDSGRILYGVLSFGGVLGMGEKLFAIPWPALPLAADEKTFVLNVEKDRLKNASTFDKRQWPNFADEQFSTATYKYYNQTPYWTTRDGVVVASTGNEVRTSSSYRERWNQRSTSWQKASDLSGKEVRNNQNDDLGKISELVIDPQSGRILYGVLSAHGKFFAIPWPALRISADFKQFVLNASKDQLKDSVSFGKDNWPNMADQHWASEVYAYYNVQPYWTDGQPERTKAMP